MESSSPATTPRLLVGAREAAELLGLGRTSFLTGVKCGEIGPRPHRIGRRCLWATEELAAWTRHGCPGRARWLEMWPKIREGQP